MTTKPQSLKVGILALFPALAGVLYAITQPGSEEGLSFSNDATAFYDSNIAGNADSDSDIELTYSPTLNFTRRSGLIGMSASLGATFGVFADNDEFDYELFRSNLNLSYPNTPDIPYSLALSGGYNESSEVDTFSGRRREKALANFAGSLRYNVNERWGFRVNGGWTEVDYADAGLPTQTTIVGGVDLVYIYSENLEIFGGYSYSDTSAGVDSETQTFRLRLEGEITPKVTGVLGVGYQIRETEVNDSGDPYVNLDLSWAVNERFEVVATAGMGFYTTSLGNSGQRISGGLAGVMALGGAVSVSLGANYQDQSYDSFGLDRSDEFLSYQAGIVWQMSSAARVTASVTFIDVDSTRDFLVYERLRAGLGFNYTF